MKHLLQEICHNPMLWLPAFVPLFFAAARLKPEAHTLLEVEVFSLSNLNQTTRSAQSRL